MWPDLDCPGGLERENGSYVLGYGLPRVRGAGADVDAVRSDHGPCRADGRVLRRRGLRRAEPVGGRADRLVDRRLRGADDHELRGAAVGGRRDGAAGDLRRADGRGVGADACLVRHDQPGDPVAGGRCDGAVHRRVRRVRVPDAAGPVGVAAVLVHRADRAAARRDRADLRAHSARVADLRGARAGDLRRADGRGLPAAAPLPGARLGAADRRVHLPGHPQRLLVLPADLLRVARLVASRQAPGPHRPQGPDLDKLLALVGRGDQVAFETLYDRVAAAVFGLVRRVLRDTAQSEEVAQEALLEVWRTGDRFDPAG